MDQSRPLLAALWMSGAVVSFVLMAVAGRAITVEMNTFELMLYRSIIGFFVVSGLIAVHRLGFAQIRTRHPGLHLMRNVFHFTGQNLWFYGLTVIPLSQLVALEFTNPIWVALLAPLMLSERMTLNRALAAILGFVGVMIVLQPGIGPVLLEIMAGILRSLGFDVVVTGVRPGLGMLHPGHAAALGAALGFALNTIFTRQIMYHDTVLCVLFWMTLSQAGMGLVLSLPGGIPWPSLGLWPWIAVVGACGLSAHYCLTSALGHAPATVVAPMEFLRLPLIAVVGFWLFDEPLVLAVFLGAAVIITGNFINLYGERKRPVGA